MLVHTSVFLCRITAADFLSLNCSVWKNLTETSCVFAFLWYNSCKATIIFIFTARLRRRPIIPFTLLVHGIIVAKQLLYSIFTARLRRRPIIPFTLLVHGIIVAKQLLYSIFTARLRRRPIIPFTLLVHGIIVAKQLLYSIYFYGPPTATANYPIHAFCSWDNSCKATIILYLRIT